MWYGTQAKFENMEDKAGCGVISPEGGWYRTWWLFTTMCAVATALFTPWEVAFKDQPGLRPYDDTEAITEYVLTSVFLLDIIVHFNLSFVRLDGTLECSRREIIRHYMSRMLVVDVIGVIPFATIADLGLGHDNEREFQYLSLLRFIRLVRLYRVRQLFVELESNIGLSLLAVTLIRNFTLVILSNHVAGCLFYFIARQHNLDQDTWLGEDPELLERLNETEKYIYSLYWAITTMTTVGYGDLSPQSTAEVIFAIVYMLYNMALNSYILGTITLLVVRGDEKTGALRRCYRNIFFFAKLNELPKSITRSLKDHLRFNLSHPEIQDDLVIHGLPAGVRRGVLKELYGKKLQETHTFEGCSKKFLQALVSNVRVDTYMPMQEIFGQGDCVPELHVMVAGTASKMQVPMVQTSWGDSTTEVGKISDGDVFCTEAFFDDSAAPWAVQTTSICRVLVIPRVAFDKAASQFPADAEIAKNNAAMYSKFCVDSPNMLSPLVPHTLSTAGMSPAAQQKLEPVGSADVGVPPRSIVLPSPTSTHGTWQRLNTSNKSLRARMQHAYRQSNASSGFFCSVDGGVMQLELPSMESTEQHVPPEEDEKRDSANTPTEFTASQNGVHKAGGQEEDAGDPLNRSHSSPAIQ